MTKATLILATLNSQFSPLLVRNGKVTSSQRLLLRVLAPDLNSEAEIYYRPTLRRYVPHPVFRGQQRLKTILHSANSLGIPGGPKLEHDGGPYRAIGLDCNDIEG